MLLIVKETLPIKNVSLSYLIKGSKALLQTGLYLPVLIIRERTIAVVEREPKSGIGDW